MKSSRNAAVEPSVAKVHLISESPQVGIFWVLGSTLFADKCVLDDGFHTTESVNGRHDHVDYWPTLRRKNRQLRDLEYEEVPRGRVLFLKESERFCVYMDRRLHARHIKRIILKCFALQKEKTDFLTDPHYTTDPDELDRLFERP